MQINEKIEVYSVKLAKKKFDLDDVLTDEVGQFGKYQIVTILLASLPVIFSAVSIGEHVFSTVRIPTRCLIPQCDGENPEFAPEWILSAIPGTSTSSFDNCERYRNSSLASEVAGQCPEEWFDTTQTEACEEYVYQNELSIVYDFGLACNEWKRSQIATIRTIGSIFVHPITGYISDRWGRRVALIINAVNTAWLGLVRSFVHSYEWFLITEALEAAIGSGAFMSCYILVTELVGPKRRVIAGTMMSTMFALGQVLLGLVAWGVPNWRPLTRVLYAPQLLFVTYFWIMSESVRWLMSKGRYEESEAILKKVAKMNKRPLSDTSLKVLRSNAEAEKLKQKPKEPWLPIQIIRSRVMVLRCIVFPILWITNTLVYYGLTINAVNISGNRYLNYVYVALVEIPGYWTAILLLDRIGRKPVLIGGYWLCAGCQFAFAIIPSEYFFDLPEPISVTEIQAEVSVPNFVKINSAAKCYYGLSLTLYLIGKYAIATVLSSVYVYTAELYPTKYRHTISAYMSMIGRFGAIAGALMPALALTVWEHLPSVLFGSMALLSGLLAFSTPETLGVKLPDTMEEAEQLSSQKRMSYK